eukprot:scaffold63700_cov27-Tisochrysis_lutea.AAC.3
MECPGVGMEEARKGQRGSATGGIKPCQSQGKRLRTSYIHFRVVPGCMRELKPAAAKGGGGSGSGKGKKAQGGNEVVQTKIVKNAFRYDDEEAEIPQHNWRQGPDFRAARVGFEAGYAVWGSNRPKVGRFGGDAPSARVEDPVADPLQDRGAARLLRETEQLVPMMSSKKLKKRLKAKAKNGPDHNVFRWT